MRTYNTLGRSFLTAGFAYFTLFLATPAHAYYHAANRLVTSCGLGETFPDTGFTSKPKHMWPPYKYQKDDTSLSYFGYRYYNPSTGRWLTRDPIEEEGGPCLYPAAANNLVDHYDILGRQHIGNLHYGQIINVQYSGQPVGFLYVSVYTRQPSSGRVNPDGRVGAMLRIEQHLECHCGGCFKWRQHFSEWYDDRYSPIDRSVPLWTYLPSNKTEKREILDIDYRNRYESDWYTLMQGDIAGCGYTFNDKPSQFPAMHYGNPEVQRVAVGFKLELVHVNDCNQTSGGETVADMRWGFWYTREGVWLFGNHKPGPPYE